MKIRLYECEGSYFDENNETISIVFDIMAKDRNEAIEKIEKRIRYYTKYDSFEAFLTELMEYDTREKTNTRIMKGIWTWPQQ